MYNDVLNLLGVFINPYTAILGGVVLLLFGCAAKLHSEDQERHFRELEAKRKEWEAARIKAAESIERAEKAPLKAKNKPVKRVKK